MARFGWIEQYLDSAGNPLSGGLLYFYDSGTTDAKTTYSDVAMTIANTNPVVLDAAGRMPPVYFSGDAKVVLKDSDGVTIDTIDPAGGESLSAAEVKTLYESNSDSNEYSDAEKTKLASVATSANNYTHPNHSGDVVSVADGAQTLQAAAITGKAAITALENTDEFLVSDDSDSGNLKRVDYSVVASSPLTFDYTTLANGEYAGLVLNAVAASAIAAHRPVVRTGASNDQYVDDAATTSRTTAAVIGVSLNTASIVQNDAVNVLLHGYVYDSAWTWTPGSPIYLNAGVLSATRPSGGTLATRVGIAMTANVLFVCPTDPQGT